MKKAVQSTAAGVNTETGLRAAPHALKASQFKRGLELATVQGQQMAANRVKANSKIPKSV